MLFSAVLAALVLLNQSGERKMWRLFHFLLLTLALRLHLFTFFGFF